MRVFAAMGVVILLMLGALTGCDVPGDATGDDLATSTSDTMSESSPLVVNSMAAVHGDYLFVIDASGEAGIVDPVTGYSGFKNSATHAVSVIRGLDQRDRFEVMSYGGATITDFCFGTFQYATPANVTFALAYLRNIVPSGESAQYSAMQDAAALMNTSNAPFGFYFYSATYPGGDPGAPGGQATHVNILAAMPNWFSPVTNLGLVAVRVGNLPHSHEQYMQQMAAVVGGSYLHIP